MPTVNLTIESHQAHISGSLVFDHVLTILPSGLEYLQRVTEAVFDFSAVTEADSASIALLLEWWRAAEKLHKKIRFVHLPASMQALIKVSDLEEIEGLTWG